MRSYFCNEQGVIFCNEQLLQRVFCNKYICNEWRANFATSDEKTLKRKFKRNVAAYLLPGKMVRNAEIKVCNEYLTKSNERKVTPHSQVTVVLVLFW